MEPAAHTKDKAAQHSLVTTGPAEGELSTLEAAAAALGATGAPTLKSMPDMARFLTNFFNILQQLRRR